jgi:NAD(P)-dependent dehydrogenase (short-subunit alcohol dehydrogenase family)
LNLARALALDHARDKIRVNALCPGAVETPLLLNQFARQDGPQGSLADLVALHPIGRLGQP